MNVDKNLEKEVLTRLLHAHPSGMGKEVLDNYRGESRGQHPRHAAGSWIDPAWSCDLQRGR